MKYKILGRILCLEKGKKKHKLILQKPIHSGDYLNFDDNKLRVTPIVFITLNEDEDIKTNRSIHFFFSKLPSEVLMHSMEILIPEAFAILSKPRRQKLSPFVRILHIRELVSDQSIQ